MGKQILPKDEDEVYEVMKEYCEKKNFTISKPTLKYWAESCYLFYSAKGWAGVKYWPAVVMKWVLTNVHNMKISPPLKKEIGDSVRERVMKNVGRKKRP